MQSSFVAGDVLDPQALLAAIVDSSDDAIIGKTLDGTILSWNRAAGRLYGYTAADVLGTSIAIIIPPDRSDELPTLLARLAQGEHIDNFQTIRLHKDGHLVPVAVTLSPIYNAESQVVGASSIARDISAQLQAASERAARTVAQDALTAAKATEARLRGLLEAAPDAMVIADRVGRMILLNGQTERLFGYQRTELLGRNVELLLPERFRSVHEGHRVAYSHEPSVRQMGTGLELHGRRRDGSEFPVEVSLSPVSVNGELLVISAIRDITDRRMTEAALQQAVAEAERANHAKSEFLSRMSHELRTPLNAVLGFGQLLELDELTPSQAKGVTHILKAGHHLLDLINEVLDIARIEAGRLALSVEPVRLRDVVRETLDLVRTLAADRQVQLDDIALAGAWGEQLVLADRQRLRQVLLNLLSNAIKYNRTGGAVTLRCDTTSGQTRLGVQDTGLGIPADQLTRVFEPFDRLGAETSTIEGTGLGLALSKGLMEAMNGTLRVESTLDVGSTFWLDLPLAQDSPVLRAAGQDDAAAQAAPPAALGQRTVLYVEDNLPNLELIEQILTRWADVTLLPATLGRLGVELATQHRPDLILLDLHLPDLSGHEVLLRLQEDERTRDIPVVVVSADATESQVTRLLAAGAREYITKPFDVRRLLTVLGELLETATV